MYQQIARFGPQLFANATLFKWGFNLSPMYRRTTARIIDISSDLRFVRIKIPLSYRNKNYVGSIFGGSMFAAVDPIPMVQLIQILGRDYVIWDKSAQIYFKRPAREDLYAEFRYADSEVTALTAAVHACGETEIEKVTRLTGRDGLRPYCEVHKTVYVATKAFYREKMAARAGSQSRD
ncbi:MAG: DUF4442 domain-containing protein [Pseudomonadota bacterium]